MTTLQVTRLITYQDVDREITELLDGQPDKLELVFRPWRPRRWKKQPGRTLHYPQGIIPIHPLPPPSRRTGENTVAHTRRHWRRVRRLVQTVEREGASNIPPILVDQGQLITGTHRWVANELLERRGRTEERIRVVELENFPLTVRFVIRLLFNAGEHTKTQPAFHLMTGLPLRKHERLIKEWLDPAIWACCDLEGKVN